VKLRLSGSLTIQTVHSPFFIILKLRQRILLSAFPKALRDPFPLARLSGVVALANTDRFYTLKDIAGKVLPSLSLACVDPEKDVRDEAFKTIKTFLQKLEKVSESPELALEMEKDVSACNLDVKNETSWTSWAMTSLSAKVSGYKNKNQQPSVALNTQPLGPPPSLNVSGGTTSSEKPSPKQQQPSQSQTSRKPEQETSRANEPSGNKEPSSAGWNLEESEWRDLEDDDDQMESFEPLETTSSSSKPATNKGVGLLASTSGKQSSNDFTSWTNSFEEDTNQLPPASSYNWSTTSTDNSRSKNEEDLFSSLVSDVSLKAKPATQPKQQQVSPNPASKSNANQQASGFNDWSSDWSNDWDTSNAKGSL
jgi:SCY1-like protein 1